MSFKEWLKSKSYWLVFMITSLIVVLLLSLFIGIMFAAVLVFPFIILVFPFVKPLSAFIAPKIAELFSSRGCFVQMEFGGCLDTYFYALLFFIFIGAPLLGFLFDSKNSKKRRLVVLAIMLIIIIPSHIFNITDSYFLNKAHLSEDIKTCSSLLWYKEECYFYTAINSNSSVACSKLSKLSETAKTAINRDNCYQLVAVAVQDTKICSLIEDESMKESCNSEIIIKKALALLDPSVCGEIPGQDQRSKCYLKIGVAKQDTKICDLIEPKGYTGKCYEYIALIKTDTKLCDKWSELYPEESDKKNFCFQQVNDLIQYCNKETISANKQSCCQQHLVTLEICSAYAGLEQAYEQLG